MTGNTKGWLVTYSHGVQPKYSGEREELEVRMAVMPGTWGWAAYATTRCKGNDTLGWYDDGENISV